MKLLALFRGSIGILAVAVGLWLNVIIQFDEERDWYTFKLGTLSFLVNPVFL
jgi:hypothetical protein